MFRHLTDLDFDVIAVMAAIGVVAVFAALVLGGWVVLYAWVFVIAVLTLFALFRWLLGRFIRDNTGE